jgi:hypothetical protein
VWTSYAADSARVVSLHAGAHETHYLFAAQRVVPPPRAVGEARHTIVLERTGDSEYRWTAAVDFAIGRIRAEDLANMLGSTLAATAARGGREIRDDYASAFQRATAVLGRLFAIDSLRAEPAGAGTTAVSLLISTHPDGIRSTLPAFARYFDKYITPARYRFVLTDHTGARWMELAGTRGTLSVRLRHLNGRLAPLDGPPRPMPDSLVLTSDIRAKFGIFEVGASNLVADFIVTHDDHQRGWFLRFRKEPQWDFPLAVDHLIRSSLRRPFAGDGATLALWVRDSVGAQTLSAREARFTVKESAIVRFLGALVFGAMSDFSGASETDEALYNAEVWNAFRADVRALSVAPAAEGDLGFGRRDGGDSAAGGPGPARRAGGWK